MPVWELPAVSGENRGVELSAQVQVEHRGAQTPHRVVWGWQGSS